MTLLAKQHPNNKRLATDIPSRVSRWCPAGTRCSWPLENRSCCWGGVASAGRGAAAATAACLPQLLSGRATVSKMLSSHEAEPCLANRPTFAQSAIFVVNCRCWFTVVLGVKACSWVPQALGGQPSCGVEQQFGRHIDCLIG